MLALSPALYWDKPVLCIYIFLMCTSIYMNCIFTVHVWIFTGVRGKDLHCLPSGCMYKEKQKERNYTLLIACERKHDCNS